jgi:hypothetical protein
MAMYEVRTCDVEHVRVDGPFATRDEAERSYARWAAEMKEALGIYETTGNTAAQES